MRTFFLMIFCSVTIFAKNPLIPDYATLQYAGNIGLMGIGSGYQFFDDSLQVGVIYGYLPESIGGVLAHSLSLKTTYIPWHIDLGRKLLFSPFMIGITMIHNLGNHFFLIQPNRYPDGYYRQTALHFAPFTGMKLIWNKKILPYLSGVELYFEVGSIDYYLRDYLISKTEEGYLSLSDIINVAMGCRFYF